MIDFIFCKELFYKSSHLYQSPIYWNVEDTWYDNFDDDTIFESDQCFHDSNFIV